MEKARCEKTKYVKKKEAENSDQGWKDKETSEGE